MKNKLLKRISAAFIAMCIAVSLVPAVFADGEGTKTYEFYAGAAGVTAGETPASKVTDFGTHGWKYLDINDASLSESNNSYRVMQMYTTELRLTKKYSTTYNLTNPIKISFILQPPETGFYRVESHGRYSNQLYLGKYDAEKATVEDYLTDRAKFYSTTAYPGTNSDTTTAYTDRTRAKINGIVYSDGTSNLALAIDTLDVSTNQRAFRDLHLVPINPTISLVVDKTTLTAGEETKAYVNATWTEDSAATTQKMLNSFVDYELSDDPSITIDELGNIKATKAGPTTITVTYGEATYEATVNVVEESPEYVSAFKPDSTGSETVNEVVSPLVYAKDGTELTLTPSATKNADGTWLVSTDAESGDYKFLYWAKGLSTGVKRRIVSRSASFNYDAENEGNYLIAVYEKEGMKTSADEYYNANGQLLENGNTLPYLAGYNGAATGWEARGDGMHVAIFPEENRATYTITVDGKEDTYHYGDPVVCTADAEKDGKKFFGWRKTVNGAEAELVSASTTYTFNAWENCEVTAVYEDESPVFSGVARKIVLGTFNVGNETAIMAEFIGFGNDVVERGISLGGTDIAMTTKEYNQFTIINNDNLANISGYAILADGTKVIYNK